MDEVAVVRAVPGDRRQRARLARLAGHDLFRPAVLHVGEEIDAVFLLVGEDDVVGAVFVDVDETEARVCCAVTEPSAWWQSQLCVRYLPCGPIGVGEFRLRRGPTHKHRVACEVKPSGFQLGCVVSTWSERKIARRPASLGCPVADAQVPRGKNVYVHVAQRSKPHGHTVCRPRLRIAQRMTAQHVLVQPLLRLAERQELHFLAVLRHRVVDEVDDLLVLDPAVRVEDQAEDALLDDRGVKGGLPVAHGDGVVRLVIVLGRPVARLPPMT